MDGKFLIYLDLFLSITCLCNIKSLPFMLYLFEIFESQAANFSKHQTLQIESNIVRCPDPEYAEKMIAAIDTIRVKGDSIGGVVTCIVKNCPRVRILPLSLFP